MKKKGFTLIELLAVIVILAVISLIATPMILNVIENAKKGSSEASANAYRDALTQLIAENEIKGTNKLKTNNTYYVTRGTTIDGIYYEAINDIIKIKGYKPTGYDDYIKFGKNYEIEEAILTINGYEIKIENNKVITMEKGKIIELDYITVRETETMERGSSYTIETIFEPINTSDQRLKYTSSDNSVVTVDENGLVKSIKNGEAKITVTPLSNKNLKKEITITVISPSEVTGIKLNKKITTIGLGKSEDIIATLEPSGATSTAFIWKSNNDAVSVNDSGKITGIKLGTSTVTATTQSGLKASIEVTVEYEITLNEQKYYTTNDNITIDNVDTTNKTNISCNNGSIPSINGNNVTITNITNSVECVINDSLKETFDNIDSSLNNILMINDENLYNQEIIINKFANIIFDINGKTIISTFDEDKPSILNNGNLTIKDSLSTGLLKTNYRLIKSFGNLKIESGNYKRENEESVDGGIVHIENGEAILKNSNFESDRTYAVFTYNESQNASYNPIIKIDNCSISSNSTVIVNRNENGKIYLNHSYITSDSDRGIVNYGKLLNIENTTIISNKSYAVINREKGIIDMENNYVQGKYASVYNTGSGIINISGGEYVSQHIAINNNESSGTINIDDKKGKVYIATLNTKEVNDSIWSSKAVVNRFGKININGSIADICGINKNNTGICIYNDYGRTVVNESNENNGSININGAMIISEEFYGVQVGNNALINICKAYISGNDNSYDIVSNLESGKILYKDEVILKNNKIYGNYAILDNSITCEG